MRRDRIKQRILHSLNYHKTSQSLPYAPSPRYSAILGSSDRLLVIHPDPATRAPSPVSSCEDLARDTSARSQSQACTTTRSIPFSAPVPRQRWTAAPLTLPQCTHCTRRLERHEFPLRQPTANCKHENATCVYCLHHDVYTAFVRGRWKEIRCLVCGEQMSEEEASRLVLLWEYADT